MEAARQNVAAADILVVPLTATLKSPFDTLAGRIAAGMLPWHSLSSHSTDHDPKGTRKRAWGYGSFGIGTV